MRSGLRSLIDVAAFQRVVKAAAAIRVIAIRRDDEFVLTARVCAAVILSSFPSLPDSPEADEISCSMMERCWIEGQSPKLKIRLGAPLIFMGLTRLVRPAA
jgi:hypothetical protein